VSGLDEILSVFVPAYNVEKHIESVIERIPEDTWPVVRRVYLINDGSTDLTSEKCEMLATQYNKISVITMKENFGYGAVVRKGLSLCAADGCLFAGCLHGDGQYPSESLKEFTEYMHNHAIDILQGSRLASGKALEGGMPLYKYVAGKILTFLENRVFALRMSDYHSGFIMYSNKALRTIKFQALSRSFDFDLEVIASARTARMTIQELPIPTRYADEISYLNPIVYGIRVLSVLGKYLIGWYTRNALQVSMKAEV